MGHRRRGRAPFADEPAPITDPVDQAWVRSRMAGSTDLDRRPASPPS